MQSTNTCEIAHLMPAGDAGGNEHAARVEAPSRWEQPALPDGSREVEVVAAISERAGHTAATRIKVGDGGPRNPTEQGQGRGDEPQ